MSPDAESESVQRDRARRIGGFPADTIRGVIFDGTSAQAASLLGKGS
jgi:hypothetical protein